MELFGDSFVKLVIFRICDPQFVILNLQHKKEKHRLNVFLTIRLYYYTINIFFLVNHFEKNSKSLVQRLT